MIARAFLSNLTLAAVALALSACSGCFDADPPHSCPHPAPVTLPQDGPFNGGGNGM